jgi:hypothetical protein
MSLLLGVMGYFNSNLPSFAADCNLQHECEVFSEEYFGGSRVCLQKNEPYSSPDGLKSFKIVDRNAALLVRRVPPPGKYPLMQFYAEVVHPEAGTTELRQPIITGTSQYDDALVEISCIDKNLPTPEIHVPIDADDVNPVLKTDGRANYRRPAEDKKVLVLREAFFWENAEDVGGFHGPNEEINISIVQPWVVGNYLNSLNPDPNDPCFADPFAVGCYSYERLNRFESLWQGFRLGGFAIPGPIYGQPCIDDPHNEWIDGPWGARYSNTGILDWDKDADWIDFHGMCRGKDDSQNRDNCRPERCSEPGSVPCDRVGIVINGADKGTAHGDDFIDASFLYKKDKETVLVLRMNGVLKFENVCRGEPPIRNVQSYALSWNGVNPADVYAPPPPYGPSCDPESVKGDCLCFNTKAECTLWEMAGSPHYPFRGLDEAYSCAVPGSTIGLYRGYYHPKIRVLSTPITIRAVDGSVTIE